MKTVFNKNKGQVHKAGLNTLLDFDRK